VLNELYQSLDPIAFSVGPVSVRWYGLAYIFGFVAAGLVAWRTARRWGLRLTADDLLMVVVGAAFGVIVGARTFYVLFYNLDYYLANPGRIVVFNEGGMSFHGGLVGGLLGGYLACRCLRLSFATICDLVIVGAPLGLFFGRCANFVNGELWGKPTDLPWGVAFESGGGVMRHPSQLYEALLEGVLLFLVLYALSRKVPPRPQGTFVGTFLVGYGCLRFLIEFVRVPDAQLGYLWGPVTMGQLLSLPLVAAGAALLVYARKRRRPQTLASGRFGL
jgi:phosphatidylglycerol:prolipoprotein diacylglycerol transferase